MITITAKVDGFRRAGVAHPASATEYPDDTFTAGQLVALRAEPMLVVEEKPDPAKAGKKPGRNDDPKPDPKPEVKDEEKPGPEGGDPAPKQGA